jgi:hypothetical protein
MHVSKDSMWLDEKKNFRILKASKQDPSMKYHVNDHNQIIIEMYESKNRA